MQAWALDYRLALARGAIDNLSVAVGEAGPRPPAT
jgi:hypothetical protein